MAIGAEQLAVLRDVYGVDFFPRDGESNEDVQARVRKQLDEMGPDRRYEAQVAMQGYLTLSKIEDDLEKRPMVQRLGISVAPVM